GQLKGQCIDVTFSSQYWDAMDLRITSRLVDTAVNLSRHCDQVFLLASNFSDSLSNEDLREHFQHFSSQFSGRIVEQSSVCWVEPPSNKAERVLSVFGGVLSRLVRWLRFSAGHLISGVRYRFLDPVTSNEMHSGVRVLKAEHKGLP